MVHGILWVYGIVLPEIPVVFGHLPMNGEPPRGCASASGLGAMAGGAGGAFVGLLSGAKTAIAMAGSECLLYDHGLMLG